MAGSKMEFSYEGIGENILRADYMVAEMGRRAQAVMDEAVATAPVYEGREDDPHRSRYKESFSMHTTDHGGSKGNRAAGIVSNDAPEAVFVEFGTKPGRFHPAGQRAHATLRNALHAAGD
jgi:hypothetical protein